MEEHIYQAGSEIIASGDKCLNIYFIVNGIVDLEVFDSKGNSQLLGQLCQGDLIGQYSALFSEDLSFSVISKTQVRMLTLPERFFSSFSNQMQFMGEDETVIDGLDEALDRAQEHVDQFGVPICDFKVYRRTEMENRPKIRLLNTVRRAKVL